MEVDRISNLPDHIIAVILSQLPVEESARTSILSKQWQHQWLLSPIYIDQLSLFDAKPALSDEEWISWCVETLTRILTVHPGPIRYCSFIDPFWVHERQTLTRLLQTLTQKGIQQLNLCLEDLAPRTLPDLLSRSLIVDLEIVYGSGPKEVIVESSSLKRLTVWYARNTEKLVIKNAPNLECFNLNCPPGECFKLTILNAPKLRVVDCINMSFSSLQLGDSRFDRAINTINFCSFSTHMHSLTNLTIRVCFGFVYQVKSIPSLLRCFPCLERLDVLIDKTRTCDINSSPAYGDYREQYLDIDCLDHHLKYVQLEGYLGVQRQVDFANFIILKARVLETMTLVCPSNSEEQWVEDQKERLILGNRASQVAQVVFL